MSVRWIEHKGIKILYTDWRHKAPKQLPALLQEYTEAFKSSEDDEIHRIADLTDVPFNEDIVNVGKQIGRDVFSKKQGKSIVLGITGIRKFYFKIYKFAAGYNLEAKDSLEEALDYIYEEVTKKKEKQSV